MPRCALPAAALPRSPTVPYRLAAALFLVASFGVSMGATAQVRSFPANALRGEFTVTRPPEVLLNRRPARLAPGARIRGADNLMQLSGALVGQRLLVHFTLDPAGQLQDVWVLTQAEAARRPWPSTPAQAATWAFDAVSQTWVPR